MRKIDKLYKVKCENCSTERVLRYSTFRKIERKDCRNLCMKCAIKLKLPVTEKAKQNMSKKRPNFTPWNKGTKGLVKAWNKGTKGCFSEESVEKMRQSALANPNRYWLGKKRPKGKLSANWKGGATKFNKIVRMMKENIDWKIEVFKRDEFTCQECAEKGYVEAHHIDRLTDILKRNNIQTQDEALNCKELWNVDNGITLCKPCHLKTRTKNINNLNK